MRKLILVCAVVLFSGVGARDARAEGALSFVIGAGFGGNFSVLSEPDLDLATAFKNSPLYGVRIGSYGFPLGFEGTLLYSPSALVGGAFDDQIEAKANILYTEANMLVIFLPGPVSPFITGGLGLHYFGFSVADFLTSNNAKFGWNWGGGLKINVERVALRFDVRDHVTTFGLGDFGLGIIGDLIGITGTDTRVHNVELSFSIGIRF